jgi:hypothetical protein
VPFSSGTLAWHTGENSFLFFLLTHSLAHFRLVDVLLTPSMSFRRAQESRIHCKLPIDVVKTQRCIRIQRLRLSGPINFVEVANPKNLDLDLITMKQFLVKAADLGNPKLGAEADGLYTVSKL